MKITPISGKGLTKGMVIPEIKSGQLQNGVRALIRALDERDRYTWEHCNRLLDLAGSIAIECRLDDDEIHAIQLAALLHDVGKIGIPDSILLKPISLVTEEWEIIKNHSVIGERIVRELEMVDGCADVAHLIRCHHEHFNGKGYPDGLSGEDIPIGSRIILIADSYDAMTTTRSYARARSHQEALVIMHEEEGDKNDSYVLRKFLTAINNSP